MAWTNIKDIPAIADALKVASDVYSETPFTFADPGETGPQIAFDGESLVWSDATTDDKKALLFALPEGVTQVRVRVSGPSGAENQVVFGSVEITSPGNAEFAGPFNDYFVHETFVVKEITSGATMIYAYGYGYLGDDMEIVVEVDYEPPAPPRDDPSDRKLQLEISKDGGHTWPIHREISLGEVGDYEHRVKTTRLGMGRRFTGKIRVTSPIRVDVFGAVADVDVEQ